MTSLYSSKWFLRLSIQLFKEAIKGWLALYIKIEVGKELINPIMGFLKSNLPALILNKIISNEGIITLIIILKVSIQPTRYINHIKSKPTTYKKR